MGKHGDLIHKILNELIYNTIKGLKRSKYTRNPLYKCAQLAQL